MIKQETGIKDLVVLEPTVFGDHRGYFLESFNQEWFDKHVAPTHFVQDNESKSSFGVLRGLHFQIPPFDQAKLVRVIQGEVIDVAVDLRRNSPTYGQHFTILLNDINKRQLFVPRGFAHGFGVLSETAVFAYKVDNYYAPTHEDAIRWDDPTLAIDWQLDPAMVKLSEKDSRANLFDSFQSPFL